MKQYPKGASQVMLLVKNPPANVGDLREAGLIPGSGRSLEKGMATHSSIIAWRIPWTRSLAGTVHRVEKSWTQLKRLSMHTTKQLLHEHSV